MNKDKIKAIIGEFICSGGTSDAAKALRDRVSSEIADRILALEKEPEEEIEWEKKFVNFENAKKLGTLDLKYVKDFIRQEMKSIKEELIVEAEGLSRCMGIGITGGNIKAIFKKRGIS